MSPGPGQVAEQERAAPVWSFPTAGKTGRIHSPNRLFAVLPVTPASSLSQQVQNSRSDQEIRDTHDKDSGLEKESPLQHLQDLEGPGVRPLSKKPTATKPAPGQPREVSSIAVFPEEFGDIVHILQTPHKDWEPGA